jgi:hypothetical protein
LRTIEQVRLDLRSGNYDLSRHAFIRIGERNISELEVREAGTDARMIEDYPDDKYAPSCLLLGFTRAGRPLHMQVALADTPMLRIITIYEPNPGEWVDYSVRR